MCVTDVKEILLIYFKCCSQSRHSWKCKYPIATRKKSFCTHQEVYEYGALCMEPGWTFVMLTIDRYRTTKLKSSFRIAIWDTQLCSHAAVQLLCKGDFLFTAFCHFLVLSAEHLLFSLQKSLCKMQKIHEYLVNAVTTAGVQACQWNFLACMCVWGEPAWDSYSGGKFATDARLFKPYKELVTCLVH